ncbi:conserved hypothetical protein [Methanocella paludicola SANAE]|uniref:Uncharacterized protein n=1 Tax=Methanocella paludicola (strain DSM 17711 / JCM 13418 / NBRC 101707 / SANAE) TaxID=304371 RepID=D1Z0H0_METPS|nr:hypothetical protein [Methanocella paludicola]BAI62192.1 conserved hypothetical protein [Methanocella paludicola SANAE]
MTAFREGGSSRIFYVEHICQNALGNSPRGSHLMDGKIRNASYMVRMFFTGDLDGGRGQLRVNPEEFEYVTDMMPFPDKHSSGYTNCPLCGSMGRIKVDDDGLVPIFSEVIIPVVE